MLGSVIDSKEETLEFVNKYSIVTLFPIRGRVFPSLYSATKGNRQEKFDKAWMWADELAMERLIHYGKLVHKQVTLVSLELFPSLYTICRTGNLSINAKRILSFLETKGATSTTLLRKSLGFWGSGKKPEFTKAIDELQLTFNVAIVGRQRTPRMTYTYDLIERWLPKSLFERTQKVDSAEAKARIAAKLVENHVISKPSEVEKLFSMGLSSK